MRNGIEWLSIKLLGQSFMLHQIRKMVSMAILMMRHDVPDAIIAASMDNVKINIPKAPSLGLLLLEPRYDASNLRLDAEKERNVLFSGEPVHFRDHQDEVNAFKERYIYSQIVEVERQQNT